MKNLFYEQWDGNTKIRTTFVAKGWFPVYRRIALILDEADQPQLIYNTGGFAGTRNKYYYAALADESITPQLIMQDSQSTFTQDLQLLVSPDNHLHSFISKQDTLYHVELIDGTWHKQSIATCDQNNSSVTPFRTFAAFDSQAKLHIILHCYDGYSSNTLKHATFNDSSWSPITVVIPNMEDEVFYLSLITIDANDRLLIAHRDDDRTVCEEHPVYISELNTNTLLTTALDLPTADYACNSYSYSDFIVDFKVDSVGQFHILIQRSEYGDAAIEESIKTILYSFHSDNLAFASVVAKSYRSTVTNSFHSQAEKLELDENEWPVIGYFSDRIYQASIWDISHLTEQVFLPLMQR